MTVTPAKGIPYSGTSVAPEKTQGEIQKMLYEFGAAGVQWTDIPPAMELKFVFTDKERRPFTIRVRPAMLTVRKKSQGRYGEVQTQVDKAASLRLLYWWLKSKLEAISYGLVTFEEEFLANIAGKLPSGVEVTVGDLLIPKLLSLDMTDLAKALPEPKKETSR